MKAKIKIEYTDGEIVETEANSLKEAFEWLEGSPVVLAKEDYYDKITITPAKETEK